MSVNDALVPNRIILGERNHEAATALLISRAERQLKIFDPDLSRGGYQGRSCHALLQDFLAKNRQNRLTIILHDCRFLTANCPRLINLMRDYSHAITVYLTDTRAHVAQDAFVLADNRDYLHRFHIDHARFKYGLDDQAAAKPLHERFDQLLEATDSILSITTLGL
ncbi:hypothetical protein MTYP_02417 [Methylophilaceae bacterium]|nr:hypothetical protein MTYP_02417 [Methylophilaceae bacterium]